MARPKKEDEEGYIEPWGSPPRPYKKIRPTQYISSDKDIMKDRIKKQYLALWDLSHEKKISNAEIKNIINKIDRLLQML